jgi:serine/threonine protein phosphatase 1
MSIKYIKIEKEKNVYVVGDIHGCYTRLIEKLKSIRFNFDHDILLSVGDLVDRGPENEKCITLIDEPWFHCVRGNHEDYCLNGALEYEIEIYHKMTNNGGEWLYKYPKEERCELIKKFNDLPYMMEVEYGEKKFGLVHADLPLHDWDVLKIMLENDDEWNDRPIKDHLTWGQNLVYDSYAEIANIDYVFLGHTVLNNPKAVGNAIFIDTGAVFGNGRDFTILNLSAFL